MLPYHLVRCADIILLSILRIATIDLHGTPRTQKCLMLSVGTGHHYRAGIIEDASWAVRY
jgi:hypothetical protein